MLLVVKFAATIAAVDVDVDGYVHDAVDDGQVFNVSTPLALRYHLRLFPPVVIKLLLLTSTT